MAQPQKLSNIVERLSDSLNSYLLKSSNYQDLQQALDSEEKVDVNTIEKLFAICTKDMSEDMKYAATAMSVIPKLLDKVKKLDKDTATLVLLKAAVPSAEAVLYLLKVLSMYTNTTDAMLLLSMEILKTYPPEVIACAFEQNKKEIMDIINMYLKKHMTSEKKKGSNTNYVHILPFNMIDLFLNTLPPKAKEDFIEEGLKYIFFAAITKLFSLSWTTMEYTECIDTVESIVKAIFHYDYSNNPYWQNQLECICNVNKHPSLLKRILQQQNDNWYRLWIILIKLLKNQVTKVNTEKSITNGSPINSLLPVVEMAFKMDTKARCQAFLCWEALIDNFSSDLSDSQINKRLKLLIVPLKSSNAKVEETTLAKFNAWWRLIRKYYTKIDRLANVVLIPFLHFCFGRNQANGKIVVSHGCFNDHIKKLTVEALVDIMGHVYCERCVMLPPLEGKIISTKMLVDHWNDWVYSLKAAIRIAASDHSDTTFQQVTCLWLSFALTIGELPENNIRKDIFIEFLSIITDFLKECKTNKHIAKIVFEVLIDSMFREQENIQKLLKSKGDVNGPMHKILAMILQPWLDTYFTEQEPKKLMEKFKPLTEYILDKTYNSPDEIIAHTFKELYPKTSAVILWAALADAMCESQYNMCEDILKTFLGWPIKFASEFSDEKILLEIWYVWFTLYNSVPDSVKNTLYTHVIDTISERHKLNGTSTSFEIYATLAVLKNQLATAKASNIECSKGVELFIDMLKKVDTYQFIEKECPLLIDTLVLMLHKTNESTFSLKQATTIVSIVLGLFLPVLKLNKEETNIILFLENTLRALEPVIDGKSDPSNVTPILEIFIEYLPLLTKDSLRRIIREILIIFCSNGNRIEQSLRTRIKAALASNNKDKCNLAEISIENKTNSDNKFISPETKSVEKTSKKKEAKIVNSVVVNGEEYVVVKSNWKFNPRKLTENQKEKLKRKREDIPALYQDLSQSQDDFKLTPWKTDSQDTSTTGSDSKSVSKNSVSDVSIILKNMPSTDVVPTIMENILSEKSKADLETSGSGNVSPKVTAKNNITKEARELSKVSKNALSTKEVKSPRLALKDRVFRNVRNLIEKSNLQSDNKSETNVPSDLNKTINENTITTPAAKSVFSSNVTTSAPSKLAERPSRVKKTPKKFDDSEVISLKKKRRSLSNSQSDGSQNDSQSLGNELPVICISGTSTNETNKTNDEIVTKDQNIVSDTILQTDVETKTSKADVIHVENSVEEIKVDQTKTIPNKDLSLEQTGEKMDVDVSKATETTPAEKERKTNSKNIDPTTTTPAVQSLSKNKDASTSKTKNKANTAATLDEKDTKKNEEPLSKNLNENDENNDSVNMECVTSDPLVKSNDEKSAVSTPKPKSKNVEESKSLKKKTSRIEKQLLIDTVEGHPLLQQSQKRTTRKAVSSPADNVRRKRADLVEKLNKSKSDIKNTTKKLKDKDKEKSPIDSKSKSVVVSDSEDLLPESSQEIPHSEDVIESSQDSSITTISVTSSKNNLKKKGPYVIIESNMKNLCNSYTHLNDTEKLIQEFDNDIIPLSDTLTDENSKDDIELPKNQTLQEDTRADSMNLTEEMDTEPIEDKESSGEVILINDDPTPIEINTEDTNVGPETQEIAEADTQPMETESCITNIENIDEASTGDITNKNVEDSVPENIEVPVSIVESGTCSPLKNDFQKKKDFLNDTLEISPIKTMSPVPEKKSTSPETSSDYVVIQLTSPVQSNGEPYNKEDSPEIFTEDKISPEKRDQSPPRPEVIVNSTSPSSSLSLKKNRPQVRPGGRAAHMLGLCAPDKLKEMMNSERSTDADESKKNSTLTPARRNLRILYNTVTENNENLDETDENEQFLQFKRTIPTSDCSPSVPILKRKLAEISDDATISPASKRKRVSFHDPPVSTTIAVQKYIEPGAVRSPQSSALKRLERQLRSNSNMKSPRKLDNVFKLDSALTKTVESFTEEPIVPSIDDTQLSSMDVTPIVEVVKTSDLNNTDPICPDLLDCKDPINDIASELSSPGMKELLIKELEGKVETVGDLAKMTELEVNRLCIKAPKVKIAKKVLGEYVAKRKRVLAPPNDTIDECLLAVTMTNITTPKTASTEVQTNALDTNDGEMQTDVTPTTPVSVQTDSPPVSHCSMQTIESGFKSTKDVIASCLNERPDFVEQLGDSLPTSSIQQLTERLSIKESLDCLLKKTDSDSVEVLDRVLSHQSRHLNDGTTEQNKLSFLRLYLSDRFSSKDLILFCSQLLQNIHDKPA